MDHQDAQLKFFQLRDRELPLSDEKAVRDHLAACASCAEWAASWERTSSFFSGLRTIEAPPRFVSQVMSRLPQPAAETGAWRTWLRSGLDWLVPVAAFAGMAFFVRLNAPSAEALALNDVMLLNEHDNQASYQFIANQDTRADELVEVPLEER